MIFVAGGGARLPARAAPSSDAIESCFLPDNCFDLLEPLMVRRTTGPSRTTRAPEGDHRGTASWFETAFGLLIMRTYTAFGHPLG